MGAKFFLEDAANIIVDGDFLLRLGCDSKQVKECCCQLEDVVKRAFPEITDDDKIKEKVDDLILAGVVVGMADKWTVSDMNAVCDCKESHLPISAWFIDVLDARLWVHMMNVLREEKDGM